MALDFSFDRYLFGIPSALTGVSTKNKFSVGQSPYEYPEFQGGYTPARSLLLNAQDQFKDVSLDKRAANKLREEGLRTGESPWANLMNQKQDLADLQGKSSARELAQSQAQDAISRLAMKSGVGSGAKTYLQRQGMQQGLEAAQNVGAQTARNRLDIGIQDEQNRGRTLASLPGMEAQQQQAEMLKPAALLAARQYDIGQETMSENAKNAFNLEKYKAQMGAWGAGKTAEATANGGKKGGK